MTTLIPRSALLHSDLGQWSAEASSLGLAPGQWPTTLEVTNDDGSVTVYAHPNFAKRDGEITHVVYRTAGSMLLIWND